MRHISIPITCFVLVWGILPVSDAFYAKAEDRTSFWRQAQDGQHIIMMRHALAPGTGDPTDFAVRDCSTQRNLSDGGRRQAARIGDAFRRAGLDRINVYSSQWCRCLETARLLYLGPVKELPIINSFFRQYERREPQTADLRAWLKDADLDTPTVLVTHQVNISALAGEFTRSGEMVLIRRHADGRFSITASLAIE